MEKALYVSEMESFGRSYKAIVIGASGGIGFAVKEALQSDTACAYVEAVSRKTHTSFDLEDERSIAVLADRLNDQLGDIDLVIVATGALTVNEAGPEKALKGLDPSIMAKAFAINAIGPALILKHFHKVLPRKRRCVVAALSARVGSIGDNRLGGWYSYRASKAALNQLIRTAAIEIGRTRKDAVCAAIHPGTVETSLSAPFAPGRVVKPDEAATNILRTLDGLRPSDTGGFFAFDGKPIAW